MKIVVGGPHINSFPLETIQLGVVDYALPGYGEKMFPRLIEAIDNDRDDFKFDIPGLYCRMNDGRIRLPSNNKQEPAPLDELPFPNRRLINLNDYYTVADRVKMTTLYSSRGCPFKCIFCDVQEKRFNFRSAKKVVDELEEIKNLGIEEMHIFDDTFNLRRQRVIDICEEIGKRRLKIRWSARVRVTPFDKELAKLMKKAGCMRLHIGIESLQPEILKFMRKAITVEQIKSLFKICNEFRIETLAYFILGAPNETEEHRMNLVDEIKKLKPTYVYFNILCPLPNTQYYNMLLEKGVYKNDFWNEFIRKPTSNFAIPFPLGENEQRELEKLVDALHKKFFLNPKFIFRELMKNIFNPFLLLIKIKIGLRLILKGSLKKKPK